MIRVSSSNIKTHVLHQTVNTELYLSGLCSTTDPKTVTPTRSPCRPVRSSWWQICAWNWKWNFSLSSQVTLPIPFKIKASTEPRNKWTACQQESDGAVSYKPEPAQSLNRAPPVTSLLPVVTSPGSAFPSTPASVCSSSLLWYRTSYFFSLGVDPTVFTALPVRFKRPSNGVIIPVICPSFLILLIWIKKWRTDREDTTK